MGALYPSKRLKRLQKAKGAKDKDSTDNGSNTFAYLRHVSNAT